MHLPNHLLSPTEAIVGGVAAAALIAVAVVKTKKSSNSNTLPMMTIMGAFVFAAQMINYTIPGAACSGHLLGGVLLASILGPWAGFLTLSAVVAVQALLGDGGLAVLGANILNMAAIGCLVAYPLVFRKLLGNNRSPLRIVLASVVACTVATTLGALAVVIENALAGAGSALPFGNFLGAMLPTHLAIGAIEGVITGLLLWAVGVANATVLNYNTDTGKVALHKPATTMIAFAIGALLLGFGVSRWASTAPDGLEWSVEKAEQVDQR